MRTRKQIEVSHAALMGRVNRKLAKRGQKLYKERGLHEYFLVDTGPDARVLDNHADLETLARKVGALKPWEYLEKEA